MLFNSYEFILLYLPVTLLGFFILGRYSAPVAAGWLTLASLFFYGWWNPAYVGLLLGSIVFNYIAGTRISTATAAGNTRLSRILLTGAVTLNLGLLAYYKYAGLLTSTINDLSGTSFDLGNIILPLGISFFTFTQIAFLVDAYRGEVREYRFIHYGLFVTYFPHLIAGPVLHHKEMMPQFDHPETYRLSGENFAVGLTIFAIGLFKKVVLADNIAPYADEAFDLADAGGQPTLLHAWGGALAYTMQLYFDFSGYSDMAIGLSRLFGVKLPLNFFSPYKAVNIVDFWRRWHMTLSRFLRDYLYIPLGGNRRGKIRRHVNLMLTMLLGGLWHGAGWTFVVWGGLHGAYLVVNHFWQTLREKLGHDLTRTSRGGRIASRALTFLSVIIAWVFFRSTSFDGAWRMIQGMVGLHGADVPALLHQVHPVVTQALSLVHIDAGPGGATRFVLMYAWIAALIPIVFLAPNTSELLRACKPALDYIPRHIQLAPTETRGRLIWIPSVRWAMLIAVVFALSFLSLSRVSEFLYYQF